MNMYNYVQIIFTSFAIISEILSTKVTSEFRRETIENDYFPPKYFCQYKFKNRKIDLIYKPFPNKQYLRFWNLGEKNPFIPQNPNTPPNFLSEKSMLCLYMNDSPYC